MASAGAIRAGGAFVEITGENEGVKKSLNETKALLNGVVETTRVISMALVGVATALDGALWKTVTGAALLETVTSKFKTVFGDGAQEAEAWANGVGKAIGKSRRDMLTWMATAQDTFVPMGFAKSQAAELSKLVVRLGADLASFSSGIEDQEAQDRIISALVGNHESVRAFGVIISEATLNEKLLEMGIVGGTNAATEQAKILARLSLIIQGTTDAHGDAAKTQDEFTNTTRRLQGKFKDLMDTLGGGLMPKFKELAVAAEGWIGKAQAYIELNPQVVDGLFSLAKMVTYAAGAFALLGAASWLFANPTIIAIAAVAIALIALLDYLGVIDTGFEDMFSNIEVGGKSLATHWELITIGLAMSFMDLKAAALEAFDYILIGLAKFGVGFAQLWLKIFRAPFDLLAMIPGNVVAKKAVELLDQAESALGEKQKELEGASLFQDSIAETRDAKLQLENDYTDANLAGLKEAKAKRDAAKKNIEGIEYDPNSFELPSTDGIKMTKDDPDKDKKERKGIIGFFGGSKIGEMLGEALGADTIPSKQLTVLEKILVAIKDSADEAVKNSPLAIMDPGTGGFTPLPENAIPGAVGVGGMIEDRASTVVGNTPADAGQSDLRQLNLLSGIKEELTEIKGNTRKLGVATYQ